MNDSGLIRHRMKIEATITNAKRFIDFQNKGESFSNYLWTFVNNRTIQNNYNKIDQVPDQILLSEVISKELKKLGFKFVGPKVIYSHMQATGLVNDHIKSCFRYRELKR